MRDVKEKFHTMLLKRKSYFEELIYGTQLNMIEIEILHFLKQYPQSNTFTKIQESKDYAKSHVSTAIQNLVKKEYLVRTYAPNNKKVFHLQVLDKSKEVIQRYEQCCERFNQVAFQGVNDEEKQAFLNMIDKMIHNLEKEG